MRLLDGKGWAAPQMVYKTPGRSDEATEPTRDPSEPFPAPPDVAIWVSGDIANDVKAYAERREAEKRNLYPTFQRGGMSAPR